VGEEKGLAQMAMDAVGSGRVKIHPERYAKTYLDWLGEKRDWCISRQLWWGHRIPIWYAKCGEKQLKATFGSRSDVAWRFDEQNDQWLICALTDIPELETRNSKLETVRDPDVLDTWFSSALWPHSTLGWPEKTAELAYYYPTSVLVTSRDIITLWVARMVLTGLFNVGDVPFRDVYITPKLLDSFGETMSKSKGNGVDPLDIIERYGTDALRYHMAYVATETQDSRMPVANVCPHCDTLMPVKQEHMYMRTRKVTCPSCKKPFRPGGPWVSEDPELKTAKQASEVFEQGRNFANKLWNAARFVLMNLEGYSPGALPPPAPPCKGGERTSSSPPYEGGVGGVALPIEDRWILSRLAATAAAVTGQLEAFCFSEAARTLYDFTWSEFCDWYVEMAKSRLQWRAGGVSPPSQAQETSRLLVQRLLVGVLDAILRLLHPIMPFVTESIWQALNEVAFERGLPKPETAVESVMIAPWPSFPPEWRSSEVEGRIGRMQELVRQIRNIRNQFSVNERATVDVSVRCPATVAADLCQLVPFIGLLAKVGRFECGPDIARPPQSATAIHADFEAYVDLKGLIDVPAEIKRMEKQRTDKEKQLQGVRAKLANASFIARAPAEVVQQQKQQEVELVQQIMAIEENLQQLRQG
jgi:valyl-tRNA synthetase